MHQDYISKIMTWVLLQTFREENKPSSTSSFRKFETSPISNSFCTHRRAVTLNSKSKYLSHQNKNASPTNTGKSVRRFPCTHFVLNTILNRNHFNMLGKSKCLRERIEMHVFKNYVSLSPKKYQIQKTKVYWNFQFTEVIGSEDPSYFKNRKCTLFC